MKYLAIILFIFFCLAVNGQQRKFNFADDVCLYEGTYDSRKYSQSQIENTYTIINNSAYSQLSSPRDYKTSSPSEYNQILHYEYQSAWDNIMHLDLPEEGNWKIYRDSILLELGQQQRFYTILKAAQHSTDYKELDQFWASDPLLEKYKNGLQGSDEDLQLAWEYLVRKRAENNGSPENVWNEYRSEKNSSRWREYAREEILNYGWHNAANHHIERFSDYRHNEEFRALFSKIKEKDCDEP